jgi:tRNA G37 N-methylase Trm5
MVPVDAVYLGPERGAHSPSWARIEKGEVVLVALRERRLDGGKGSGKFRDLVSSTTSVVVASKTEEGLARASKLAVVPYGDGRLTLEREAGESTHVDATEHYFGGGSKTERLPIENGRLHVALRERAGDGSIIEWIELNFGRKSAVSNP